MSIADIEILKSKILQQNNTFPLMEALNTDSSSGVDENSRLHWFCNILENKTVDVIDDRNFFDCWAMKASILANIMFLRETKMELYNLTQEHKKVDTKINNLLLQNARNLNILLQG